MNRRMHSVILAAALVFCAVVSARTITVDDDGPADFNNIQAAIDDANEADTIIVAEGVYAGDVDFSGENIVVTSSAPGVSRVVEATKIQGSIRFRGTEEASCVLAGFAIDGTITGYDRQTDPTGKNHTRATISNCVLRNVTTACGEVIAGCDGRIGNCLLVNITYMCAKMPPVPQIVGCHGLIESCTMVNMQDGIDILEGGTCTIRGCILRGASPIIVGDGATLDISYCSIEGGRRSIEGNGLVNWGLGNIDGDPCFARAGYRDPNGTPEDANDDFWVPGDYHLKSQAGRWDPPGLAWVRDAVTSPCIDAGNPGIALGDEPNEPANVRINMGAYAGTAEASRTPAGWGVLADLTNDGAVAFADFAGQAGDWMRTETDRPGDLNRNGIVAAPDVVLLAREWLGQRWYDSSEMVLVEGGQFLMGDHLADGAASEKPVHLVSVDSFHMGRYEITNRLYCEYLNSAESQGLIDVNGGLIHQAGSGVDYPYCDTTSTSQYSEIVWNGSDFTVTAGREDHPMVQVSWYGAVAYCNWRSEQAGYDACYDLSAWTCDLSRRGYRLATEAEWEYAARGGLAGKRFPWGDTISHSRANYDSDANLPYDLGPTRGYHPAYSAGSMPYTNPAGGFPANGYGLYEMAGNVWEWCNDWYADDYYASRPTPDVNPPGPDSGINRVFRGGCWFADAHYARLACRLNRWPGIRYGSLGFRIVLDGD